MKTTVLRVCPVCGVGYSWAFGLVRHWIDGRKYVHVKFVNDGVLRVSILRDGILFDGNVRD
jgi:hypothetical protein